MSEELTMKDFEQELNNSFKKARPYARRFEAEHLVSVKV